MEYLSGVPFKPLRDRRGSWGENVDGGTERFLRMDRAESTYLITFSCYGAHLHGDDRGSVDRQDAPRRHTVLGATRQTCEYRGWMLLAAHVRTTHVHVVIAALERPEKIMSDLKRYAAERHFFGYSEPKAMGSPWEYTVLEEHRGSDGSRSLCC